METWQFKALESYKQGDYKKSYEFFTRALSYCSSTRIPDQITVLDQRAACSEKLKDLNAALNDAKLMMKTDKTHPKSYLRLGKVLKKLGRDELAWKVYQKGLNEVPSTHKLRQSLVVLASDNQPVNKKGVDPIVALPFELLHLVFSNLSFKALVKCLRVSKKWRQHIGNNSSLWNDVIDFSKMTRGQVTRKLFQTYLKYAMPIRTLKLCNVRSADEKSCLHEVVERVRYMEELDLQLRSVDLFQIKWSKMNFRLRRLVVKTPYSANNLVLLLSIHELQSLEWKCTSSSSKNTLSLGIPIEPLEAKIPLKKLKVTGEGLDIKFLRNILEFSDLDSLELYGCISWNRAGKVVTDYIKGKTMSTFAMQYPSGGQFPLIQPRELQSFAFHGAKFITPSAHIPILTDLSTVETLDLTGASTDNHGMSSLLKTLKKCRISGLKTLILDYSMLDSIISAKDMAQLSEQCPNLQFLSCVGAGGVEDFTFDSVDQFSNLTAVNISGTTVTRSGLQKILKHGVQKIGVENLNIPTDLYNYIRNKPGLVSL